NERSRVSEMTGHDQPKRPVTVLRNPQHFDIRTVWIVQLFGCKTWRLGDKPAVEQPSHNCVLPNGERHVIYDGRELEAPTRMRTYNLFPGDWLLVPKGVWHETTTTAGSVSATLAAPEGS
ncbi:JmjC domain-containing protein, partial [Pseudomonas aeruginosa]|uniref:JmjC domain-containing protein n=1 Tax=Pseudomonas aeruginosa TaxID=287 RepID=UPI003CC61155